MKYIKWVLYEVRYNFWWLILKAAEYVYKNAKWKSVKCTAFRISLISFMHLSAAFMALVKLGKRELTKDVVRAYGNLVTSLDAIMAE